MHCHQYVTLFFASEHHQDLHPRCVSFYESKMIGYHVKSIEFWDEIYKKWQPRSTKSHELKPTVDLVSCQERIPAQRNGVRNYKETNKRIQFSYVIMVSNFFLVCISYPSPYPYLYFYLYGRSSLLMFLLFLLFLCFMSQSFGSLFDFDVMLEAPFSAWKKKQEISYSHT